MVKRIQILVPFFIEGGTTIDLDEPALERWTVFFLYQKSKDSAPQVSPYTFVGYSTVYRFYYHQPLRSNSSTNTKRPLPANLDFALAESELSFSRHPCRSRISQFVILPPFHGGGNGSRFYNSIFDYYHQESQTIEITVEDPNEAFDDMRDLNDLARLRKVPEFAALRINPKAAPRAKGLVPRNISDANITSKLRKDLKIAPRQFARLVEMQLLSTIPTGIRQSLFVERPSKLPDHEAKKKEYRLWQLLTKQRLYRHNKDSLMQLDRAERIDKLEDALGNVEADYARLLRTFDDRHGGKKTNGESSNGKRASPMMEDEEPSAKKIKFS
jgi:histone acetyltransferase 1